jgi:hypothetical protein
MQLAEGFAWMAILLAKLIHKDQIQNSRLRVTLINPVNVVAGERS